MNTFHSITKISTAFALSLLAIPIHGMDQAAPAAPEENTITADNVGLFLKLQQKNPQSFFSILPKEITDFVVDQIEYEQFMQPFEQERYRFEKVDIPFIKRQSDRDEFNQKLAQKMLSSICYRMGLRYNSLLDREAMFTQLVSQGVDIDLALNHAARHGYLKMIRFLLNQGADINSLTQDGDSPLIIAIKIHQVQAVKLLIEKGADINRKDRTGHNAIWYAVGNHDYNLTHQRGNFIEKSKEMMEYIISRGIDESDTTHFLRILPKDIFKMIQGYCEVDFNYCLAHVAFNSGNVALARYLIERGALGNAPGYLQVTLETAVRSNKKELVALLLTCTSCVHIIFPHSLLDSARAYGFDDCAQIIQNHIDELQKDPE